MVQLEFYDPSGAVQVRERFAPRLESLEGKRVALLSNEQWQSFRTLPMIQKLLEADFPGMQVLPVDTFPKGQTIIGSEHTAQLIKSSGVDAVIIGNAA